MIILHLEMKFSIIALSIKMTLQGNLEKTL